MPRVFAALRICTAFVRCGADILHPAGGLGRDRIARSLVAKLLTLPWPTVDIRGIRTINAAWLAARPGAVLLEARLATSLATRRLQAAL